MYSPLAEALASPLSESADLAEGTRGEQYARRGGDTHAIEARRRAILFIGGGAVTVGALAYVASHILSKGGNNSSTATASVPSHTTGNRQATTAPASPTTADGQATTAPASPTSGTVSDGNVIAQSSAIPVNSSITFTNPNPNSSQPGVLIHLPNDQFVAFDSTCTHQSSCSVQYVAQDKLLECPCHGAQFDPTSHASVVQGPAPTPLAPIAITINPDGSIATR